MNTTRTLALTLLLALLAGCESTARQAQTQPAGAPEPVFQALPRIESISPSVASPAMIVTIRGTGFGPGVVVSFGGAETVPVSITEQEIRVQPVATGTMAGDGTLEVLVRSAIGPSNTGSLRIGTQGEIVRIETDPPYTIGDVLALQDGSVLFTDPIGGRIGRIAPDGVVRTIAGEQNGLVSPSQMSEANGEVRIFDAGAATVWSWNAGTGSVSAWREGTPGWTAGGFGDGSFWALAANGASIEKLGSTGATIGILPLEACSGATSMTVRDADAFVAGGDRLCRVSLATGAETQLTLSGETVYEIASLTATDSGVTATGVFTQGIGVASIGDDGEVTLHAADLRAYPAAAQITEGGIVIGLNTGHVGRSQNGGFALLAGPVRGTGDFRQAGSRYIATAGYEIPFAAEIHDDGSYRVLATGSVSSTWTHIEAEGDGYLVAAYEEGAILRIAADGAITTAVEQSAVGPAASFARLGEKFLVSSGGPDISLYDADGTLLDAHYIHTADSAPFGMVLANEMLFSAAGDRVLQADVREAGSATSRLASGRQGLLGIAADAEGRIYVLDGNDTGLVLRMDATEFVTIGTAGPALSMSVANDGALLVADFDDVPFRMLP